MKCPNCNEVLLMTERHQVEIDYCPSCRGVWLDKGELDKLMEYASNQTSNQATYQERVNDRQDSYGQDYNREDRDYRDNQDSRDYRDNRDSRDYRDNRDYRGQQQKYPRKKKSFLSDFFDFD